MREKHKIKIPSTKNMDFKKLRSILLQISVQGTGVVLVPSRTARTAGRGWHKICLAVYTLHGCSYEQRTLFWRF